MIDTPHTHRWQKTLVRGLLLLLLTALIGGAAVVFSPPETNAQAPILPPPPPQAVELPYEAFVLSEANTFLPQPTPLAMPISEEVLTVAFSPDGKKLVTAGAFYGTPGQFKIWDLATGKELVSIRRLMGIRSVAFSPDGQTVAAGDFNGMIRLRDAATGADRAAVKAHNSGVNSIAYSVDGKSLVSASLDRSVKIWDTKTFQERKAFLGHTDWALSVAFFPDGQTVVSGSKDKTAKIWDFETGKEKFTLTGHLAGVESVAVSPDGKTVATGSWDGTIRLWDAVTGQEKGVLRGNEGTVYSVAFSPVDSNLLASSTGAGTVRLWDVKARKMIRRLEPPSLAVVGASLVGSSPGLGLSFAASGLLNQRTRIHNGAVWAVAFSADGKYLASGSSDRTAKVWDVAAARDTGIAKNVVTLNAAAPASNPVRALVYSPDGRFVALATDDMTIQIREARTGDVFRVLTGHKDVVTCLAFTSNGQTLISGSLDKTVKLWDWITGKEKHTLMGHASGVHAVTVTSDGKKVASGGDDKAIKVWDAGLGKELTTLNGHEGAVRALAFAPDNRTLASGGNDKTIKVWDVSKEMAEPITLKGHEGTIRALAFSATGFLASGSEDTTVKMWDLAQKKERLTLKRHFGEVWTLAFSPSGRTLVSGGQDTMIVVWDSVSGQSRQVLQGHHEEVTALAFPPQGDHLLSGGNDATWRWLGADSAFPIRTLAGNPGGTRFAVFSPGGERLASGGEGGNVTLWTRSLMPARYPSAMKGGSFWGVAFSPDGRTVALGTNSGVQIWDALTRQVQRILHVGRTVRLVAFSPDGQYLAATLTGQKEPEVHAQTWLFNVATGQALAILDAPSDITFAIRFSPDGKTLATSTTTTGRDKTIQLWDIPSGNLRRTLNEQFGACSGLVFLPDGTLVTSSWDKTIRFFDVDAGRQTKVWQVGVQLGSLDVSPDGSMLVAAEANNPAPGLLKVWEVSTGKEKWKLQGNSQPISAVAFTRDGQGLLAVGGKQNAVGEISFWDLSTGQMRGKPKIYSQILGHVAINQDNKRVVATATNGLWLGDLEVMQEERTWGAHGRAVTCGLFVANGNILATGSDDSTIKLWNVNKGELLATLRGHEGTVRALAVLPDGKTLLSASGDKTVKLWNLTTFQEITTFRGHTLPVFSLAVGFDGKTVASGAGDSTNDERGELILWDLETGKPKTTVNGIDKGIWSLAYSPDGTVLAAGLAKGTVKLWDVKTSQLRADFAVPDVRSLTFSRDGKFLAAGAGSVTLWDTATWQVRATLQRHQDAIHTVAFSPDGWTLASASQDGTIKLCSLSPARSKEMVAVVAPGRIVIGELEVKAEPGPAPKENPVVTRTDPTPTSSPAAPAKPKSLAWIPISEMVGLLLTLTLVIGLGVWMRVRQGRTTNVAIEEPIIDTPIEEEEPIIDTAIEEDEPPPPITFRCSACKKGLRVRAELAGKKVKCRQCGKVVPVPTPKTGGNGHITR